MNNMGGGFKSIRLECFGDGTRSERFSHLTHKQLTNLLFLLLLIQLLLEFMENVKEILRQSNNG